LSLKCGNCGDDFHHTLDAEFGMFNIFFRTKGGDAGAGKQGLGEKVAEMFVCPKCIENREAFIMILNPVRQRDRETDELMNKYKRATKSAVAHWQPKKQFSSKVKF
jgi:hypothetical protein